MSRLSELIDELCPEGVEYKKLGEVFKRLSGTPITAATMKDIANSDGDITIYAGGKTIVKAFEQDIEKANIIRVPAVLIQSRGVIDAVYCDKAFTFKNEMWAYTCDSAITLKYLCHYLKNNIEHFRKLASRMGSLPQISIKDTDNFLIPIPPLPVQEEIVRILDTFTALITELEAELEARKQQYEYYREKLLTFDKGKVEFKTMGEIGTFVRGKRFVRTDIVEKGVPCIHYGDMYMYYGHKATKTNTYLSEEKASKMRFAKKNDVIIVGAGENKIDIGIGLAWLGEEQVAVHDACYIFRSDLEPRYVSHFLRTTNYHKNLLKWVSEGKICSVSAQSLSKIIIPIPPMEKQKQIADILDRFDVLTTDLTQGIPAEIEARRQQYEYYRNKLLTFKRKETVEA